MKLIINTTQSLIISTDIKVINELIKTFTYTNKSISYQYKRLLKASFYHIQQYQIKKKCTKKEAEDWFDKEKVKLREKSKISLIKKVSTDTYQVATGLTPKIISIYHPEVQDNRVVPFVNTGYPARGRIPTLRPYQEYQLRECLSQHQGTIESATGTGKTVVIQELIRKLGLKTLVIIPSISILEQTKERFEKYFGKGKIGQYGGGKKKINDITVGCAASITKCDPELWKDIDLLIFDECHHVACATIENICYNIVPNAYYRFGFTATPYRADGADLAVEAAVFPVIHQYSIQEGISQEYLATPTFIMNRITETNESYNKESQIVRMYQKHLIRNPHVNDLVEKQVNFILEKTNKQVLILVREKEHGHELYRRIPNSTFVRTKESSTPPNKYKSLAPWMKPRDAVIQFNKGQIRCLIGTSVIGEGTDLIPVDVLVLLNGGASKGLVLQNIGRGLRVSNTKKELIVLDYYFDLQYKGTEIAEVLQRHSKRRMSYYREFGSVTIK